MLTDEELIKEGFAILSDWLKPDSELDDREALLRLIEAYERSGREFIRVIDPAND